MKTFSIMINHDRQLQECVASHPELFQANAVLIQLFTLEVKETKRKKSY
ncbi:hypothetical protein ABFG93_03975 [Pseudalkalibacillus hwajinpoensis]